MTRKRKTWKQRIGKRTPVVYINGVNGHAGALTRGDFKRAHTALYPEAANARAG